MKTIKKFTKKVTKKPIIPFDGIPHVSLDEREKAKKRMLSTGDGSIGKDINHMIQSRFKIIYVRTQEEKRVIDFFRDLSVYRGADLYQWDCDRGLLNSETKKQISSEDSEVHDNPTAVLAHIVDHAQKQSKLIFQKKHTDETIYMLLDFHIFLDGIPQIERKLKEFCDVVSSCVIVVVSPVFNCPPTLEKELTLVDFPVPSYNEIKESLLTIAKEISNKLPHAYKQAKEQEEDLVKAASGLTLTEAGNAFAMTIVRDRKFVIQTILDEKKQMIRKGGILEYRDSLFTMDDLGGLDTLKDWLKLRRLAFREDARQFGLPAPKGLLIIGIPGTGKSMACDALADLYQMPLLRLDFGAIFSAHVGESEQNIRQCLQTAEAISPSILWIDEVEKGIGGVESSNATDGGVTSRVFGTMLTWMQDKREPVFVVCTANNIAGIPPEFMRAGRFDEIFFIDLPNEEQREEVVEKLLSRKNRNPEEFDIDAIVSASVNYTPVEIEKGIDNALFVAYADGKRKVYTEDVVTQLGLFHPLYNSRREDIQRMREWALGKDGVGGRAVLANSRSPDDQTQAVSDVNRMIDLDL